MTDPRMPSPSSPRWRHDLTNQLGIILGFAELLLEELDPSDRNRGDVQEIATAAQKALDLIRDADERGAAP